MPRVEAIARSALASVDTDAHVDLAVLWVNERIQEAAAYGKFRFLRLVRSISWPATVHAGTVSVTQGSKVVTPDATALAAWSPAFARSRVIQTGNSAIWYPIAQVTASQLELESPFTEGSA